MTGSLTAGGRLVSPRLATSSLSCFMACVLCSELLELNLLNTAKPHKILSLADEMGWLTVGCTAFEEEGECTSP